MDERRATVMGLGSFGGGAGAVRYLAQQGYDVLVTDMAPAEKLATSLKAIGDLIETGSVTRISSPSASSMAMKSRRDL